MDHLLEYRDDYKDLQVTPWEDRLTSGSDRAYGADFQAEADFGKLHGFIGYGLMWSDRLFADLNRGKRFPSKYDNRHKITLSATWKCSERVELNAGWVFMTGNRVTLSLENYSYPDGYPLTLFPLIHIKMRKCSIITQGRIMYVYRPITGWMWASISIVR